MDDFFYIRKVCEGDHDAFRYFIRTYKDMAYNIAVSILKDEFAAQEAVQDAFVKVYRNIRSFNKKSTFATWFYRIVTNEALMHLRKSKKEIIDFTGEYDEDFDTADLFSVEQDEQAFIINEALHKLSPKESLALRLFYLQEESVKDVCQITGWSESSTKTILHRARKNMLKVLTGLLKMKSAK